MLEEYFTVQEYGEHEIVIQKSRFIAHVGRAETENEAQDFIQMIRKKHWNANHNCSAYLIGEHDQTQKAHDDGEPAGTAGVPILEVLKKRNIKDTVVVITRYFGGIKLGAGGLIRAYGKATSEGLKATGIVRRRLVRIMTIKIDYHWLGKIENELRASEYKINAIQYLDQVEIEVYVKTGQMEPFKNWIIESTNGQCALQEGAELYVEELVKN